MGKRFPQQAYIDLVLKGLTVPFVLSGRVHNVYINKGVVYAQAFKANYTANSRMNEFDAPLAENQIRFNEAYRLCMKISKQIDKETSL